MAINSNKDLYERSVVLMKSFQGCTLGQDYARIQKDIDQFQEEAERFLESENPPPIEIK